MRSFHWPEKIPTNSKNDMAKDRSKKRYDNLVLIGEGEFAALALASACSTAAGGGAVPAANGTAGVRWVASSIEKAATG